jgi:hypothetical protein
VTLKPCKETLATSLRMRQLTSATAGAGSPCPPQSTELSLPRMTACSVVTPQRTHRFTPRHFCGRRPLERSVEAVACRATGAEPRRREASSYTTYAGESLKGLAFDVVAISPMGDHLATSSSEHIFIWKRDVREDDITIQVGEPVHAFASFQAHTR